MKNLLALLIAAMLAAQASAASFNWTNGAADNDFSNTANWDNPPTFGATDDLYINLAGANKAILAGTLPNNPDEFRVGSTAGSAELLVTGGVHTLGNTFRVGRGGSDATVEIQGGSVSVPNSYTTFGDGGDGHLIMSGGVLNIDRFTLGQTSGSNSSIDISGGTINISLSDASPSATTGGTLRLGDGNTTVNISGTGVVNMEALILGTSAGTGLITITGGELNLTGSTMDAFTSGANPDLPILQYESLLFGDLGGTIAMEGGLFTLAGHQIALINDMISGGYLTHSGVGTSLAPIYNSQTDVTTVTIIPEPASLGLMVLAGAACLITRRRS